MTHGLPVISSRNASCPEVVGDAGILVEENKEEAWAEARLSLLKNPEQQASLAAKSRSRSNEFTWTKAGDETWKALKLTWEAA